MEILVINNLKDAFSLVYKFYHTIGTRKTEEELTNSINKFLKYGNVIAIMDNNEILAMMNLYCNNIQTLEAYVCDVYVREEYRRQGLAKKMMNNAIKICSERNFKSLRLHVNKNNSPAITLYNSLGFKDTENTDEKYKHLQEMILHI